MKQVDLEKCRNVLCSNSANGGRMKLMTVGIGEGDKPVAIPVCGPCANSIQLYIECIAEKMYEKKGPPPAF